MSFNAIFLYWLSQQSCKYDVNPNVKNGFFLITSFSSCTQTYGTCKRSIQKEHNESVNVSCILIRKQEI